VTASLAKDTQCVSEIQFSDRRLTLGATTWSNRDSVRSLHFSSEDSCDLLLTLFHSGRTFFSCFDISFFWIDNGIRCNPCQRSSYSCCQQLVRN
jgi:hypothetical protein